MHFVDNLLSGGNNRFLSDFRPFVSRISRFGLFNSLAQVTLKLTSPGVPDLYQGNELWQFSLVDPDNRHPIDYGLRERLLDDLAAQKVGPGLIRDLMEHIDDGRVKLYITWRLLKLRRRYPRLFLEGRYIPLTVEGPKAEYLCAFARENRGKYLIVVVPRWFTRLLTDTDYCTDKSVWADTEVEWPQTGSFRNLFTDDVLNPTKEWVAASDLMRDFPVSVFTLDDEGQ